MDNYNTHSIRPSRKSEPIGFTVIWADTQKKGEISDVLSTILENDMEIIELERPIKIAGEMYSQLVRKNSDVYTSRESCTPVARFAGSI
ncbi:hypothetical protein HN924_02780 [Candidatus Woesearchaeota archaeon]|jgi:hypothetical protein|nr:hypothetical protein [Candidatus Woesearchaeota archaeon]MBT7062867.1 hypothetical protein [Candidatus Woesearchaeota archaeon]MBT7402746.1 hypothetical protein [Candidatus Woesearchaeota archaeon]